MDFIIHFFRFLQDLVRMSSLLSPGCPPGRAGGGAGAAGGLFGLFGRVGHVQGTYILHRTRHVIQRTSGAEQPKHTEGQVGQSTRQSRRRNFHRRALRQSLGPRGQTQNHSMPSAPTHLPLFTIPLYLHFYFLNIPGGHKTNTFTILTSPISDP